MMKLERLINIIFYLMNRDRVTTKELSEKFEVSSRTILRDIDTLTLSGIPIYSELGVNGGYILNKNFKVNEKIMDNNDKENILTALNSLAAVYGDKKIIETLEKIKGVYDNKNLESNLEIDFSVASESPKVMDRVNIIKNAIKQQLTIKLEYTNSLAETKSILLNPIHIYYRWYAWYFLAYDKFKNEYKVYKVTRIKNISLTDQSFQSKVYVPDILRNIEEKYNQENTKIIIHYKQEMDVLVNEYFKGRAICNISGKIIREIQIKESDFISFSILLGFGDKIKISSPGRYRDKVLSHIEKIKQNFI